MAVAEHGRRRALLAPLGDQDRARRATGLSKISALEAEPLQGRRDLVAEIGCSTGSALLDLAFGRDRDAAGEIGGKPALVEIGFGGGNRGGAGHRASSNEARN